MMSEISADNVDKVGRWSVVGEACGLVVAGELRAFHHARKLKPMLPCGEHT